MMQAIFRCKFRTGFSVGLLGGRNATARRHRRYFDCFHFCRLFSPNFDGNKSIRYNRTKRKMPVKECKRNVKVCYSERSDRVGFINVALNV